MSDRINARDERDFEGHRPRNCGEHHTVGPHRAWCLVCAEWCYPNVACHGCGQPALYIAIEAVLLDHERELAGEGADPNLAELALAYQRATGWVTGWNQGEKETAADA